MRSMMGPRRTGAGIVDGPWNNFGQSYVGLNFDRGDALAMGDGKALQSSTSTIGKRSRNGASKINTHKGEDN